MGVQNGEGEKGEGGGRIASRRKGGEKQVKGLRERKSECARERENVRRRERGKRERKRRSKRNEGGETQCVCPKKES